jgi:glycosyltransferase involved in cell wall biosynthesis
MTKFSIVIPSYNHAQFIRKAVYSVLTQTLTDLELIVVDDGSMDDTLAVLSTISDSRLTVISQSNQGAHAAINRGLKEAKGDYLSILNSDDFYHTQRLEKSLAVLDGNPQIGIVSSYIQIVDENDKNLGIKHGYKDCPPWLLENPERSFRADNDLKAALLTENYLSTTSNLVFPRPWLERVGEFRPLRFAHDWDFALRMTRMAEVVLLPEPLLSYRVHQRNTIRQDQAAMIFEICWILAVHLPPSIVDADFISQRALEKRVDQLLESIYTFNCERVLNLMLLQELSKDPEQAMRLLEPNDPVRNQYMQHIRQTILGGKINASQIPSQDPGNMPDKLKRAARRLLARLSG